MLLTRPPAALFGARPGTPRSALAVRQRLLAEAALHALSPDARQPLVAVLPPGWDPGAGWRRADFFTAFDQPWISPVGLTGAVAPSPADRLDLLAHPDAEAAAQLGTALLSTAAELVERGVTLDAMLVENDTIGDRLTRQALLGASVWSRRRPGLAGERLAGVLDLVQAWFDEVTVQVVGFVTLSSGTGQFGATLVNGLEQTVRVGLDVTVSGGRDLELSTPASADLAPGERRALRIEASASGVGIHEVTLQPVSETGTPLGAPATLSIRTSNVGRIVWVVMAVGGLLLFVAVVLRIARRVRTRRRAAPDGAAPEELAPAEGPGPAGEGGAADRTAERHPR